MKHYLKPGVAVHMSYFATVADNGPRGFFWRGETDHKPMEALVNGELKELGRDEDGYYWED